MASPALNENTFRKYADAGYFGQTVAQAQPRYMTVEGTVNKTLILFALMVGAAAFTWTSLASGAPAPWLLPVVIGSWIGALILSLVTCFRPQSSPITAPIYAVMEGLVLGTFSVFMNIQYPGIVPQAVALSLGVFGIMLLIYRTGLIRVTGQLRAGIIAATGAIALLYLITMGLSMFGQMALSNFLWSPSPISIGFSLLVVGLAAFNLMLDFDLIERGANQRAPVFMEWYSGFSLMLTMVWLYIELLRLLSKLRRR